MRVARTGVSRTTSSLPLVVRSSRRPSVREYVRVGIRTGAVAALAAAMLAFDVCRADSSAQDRHRLLTDEGAGREGVR
jgi:hypothetical protein